MIHRTGGAALVVLAACGAPASDHAIHQTTTREPGGVRIQITGHDVALDQEPVASWLGQPATGRIDVEVDVWRARSPTWWSTAASGSSRPAPCTTSNPSSTPRSRSSARCAAATGSST